jgi:CyaY protein
MDDAAYGAQVASVFKRLAAAIDQADPDTVEADVTGDMVTITAPATGEKVIVNTQRAVRQLWVAGQGQGLHFALAPDGRWVDDKGKGLELFAWVSSCVEAACGVTLSFDAR